MYNNRQTKSDGKCWRKYGNNLAGKTNKKVNVYKAKIDLSSNKSDFGVFIDPQNNEIIVKFSTSEQQQQTRKKVLNPLPKTK